ELTQVAKDLIAKRGFDPVMGARPLRRTIQREIEDSLSEKILYGDVQAGQTVVVDVEGEGDEAVFTFTGRPKETTELPEAAPVGAVEQS
ncbi:MAG: NDP-hexose 4-ketoreductase, partial [Streptosporangiales bacterium]|nr:NDP-hexose 4-ketoreductase [Streptosporangiales bacterium]